MSVPERVRQLDKNDQFATLQTQFQLPDDLIYLDGNSLGPVCHSATAALAQATQQWQQDLISSWNKHGWIDLPRDVGEKVAPLIGAAPGQTICCDSISVNLFKLIAGALTLRPDRTVIVSEQDNFPTDLYMVEGLQSLLSERKIQLRLCASHELMDALDDSVALLMLTEVNFRTGARHNMLELNQAAQKHDILTLWDLAHSAGAFAVELDKTGADFAVGCGYKYLNGGPGSPAFAYIAARHQQKFQQPLSGWMGHKQPFDFDAAYQKSESVTAMLAGTPAILSMACFSGALDLFQGIELDDIEAKAKSLMQVFIEALGDSELSLITPIKLLHGNQLSFRHKQAYEICQCLIDNHIVADFRAPNILRLGFSPTFLSYSQAWQAGTTLARLIENKLYQDKKFSVRQKVT